MIYFFGGVDFGLLDVGIVLRLLGLSLDECYRLDMDEDG